MSRLTAKEAAKLIEDHTRPGQDYTIHQDCAIEQPRPTAIERLASAINDRRGGEEIPDQNFGGQVLPLLRNSQREWYCVRDIRGDYEFRRLLRPYRVSSGLLTHLTSPKDETLYEGTPGRFSTVKHVPDRSQENIPLADRIYYSLEDVRRETYAQKPGDTHKAAVFSNERLAVGNHSTSSYQGIAVTTRVYQLVVMCDAWEDIFYYQFKLLK